MRFKDPQVSVCFCGLILLFLSITNIKTRTEEVILKGSISSVKALDKKEKIPVMVLSLVSSEYSEVGDLVEAQIVAPEDSNNQALKDLRGAILKGKISELKKSRNLNRSGYIEIIFDYLEIDSGFRVPITAILRTEEYTGQNAKDATSENISNFLLSGAAGAINSLVFAPFSAIATGGLSVLVGAGIGSTFGTIRSVRAQGDYISIFPGERAKVTFLSGLEISSAELKNFREEHQQIKQEIEDLELRIVEREVTKSKIFGGTLVTRINISNRSHATLYPCDFFLLPKDGGVPVPVDLRLSGTSILRSIRHGEKRELKLHFPVKENDRLDNYKLVIIDPIDKTQLSETALN